MKTRRRRQSLQAEVPFSYAVFGNIDIHDDDLLNFSGQASPRNPEITSFLRNKSFARPRESMRRSFYMHFQREDDNKSINGVSYIDPSDFLTRVEDSAQHIWFISQQESGRSPYARNFVNQGQLFQYLEHHGLQLPSADAKFPVGTPAKWLDIQTMNISLVGEILSRFPLAPDTVNHCQYLDSMDSLVAHSTLGYFFINLMCTPVCENDEPRQSKSVMELRLDAAMADRPRSVIAAPVSVAVIVFPEWIITVHEKPFNEMDDLLKFIQVNCGDRARLFSGAVQVMTSPFIFSSLFQIVVGHQLDNVLLTMALDRLGDTVFKFEKNKEQREAVMQRITNVRRCFSECAAGLVRREHIVSVLLQPHMMDSFLTLDKVVSRQLESARAHILRLSDEINDCRDTVVVINWYHNVTNTWNYLIRGSKALRQTLLFTELSNVMYPIITIQTLYAMNVPVPCDGEGDPPVQNLKAFFVMAAIITVLLLLCSRSIYLLFHKKRWTTRLLSSME